MTHAKVMGLKEALDEARNELMEVKNDMRMVKAIVGPPKFEPPSSDSGSRGGDRGGSGGEGGDDSDSGSGNDGNGWD